MSIERIFYCDFKDCECHIRTAAARPSEGAGFLTVTGEGRAQHFCGWDCLLKRASEIPPPTIIHMDGTVEDPEDEKRDGAS